MFTERLAAHAAEARREVPLRTRASSGCVAEGGRITGVATSRGVLTADAYVVGARQLFAACCCKPLGITVPVYPVKGYSITVPITDADGAPVSTVMDETYKVAITRLGDRIRVGGTAEISGYDLDACTQRGGRRSNIRSATCFPAAAISRKATLLVRPAADDAGRPAGHRRDALRNLYLNTGHGTLGWTMACGSGRVLADIISGRRPDIDVSELVLSRYEQRFGSAVPTRPLFFNTPQERGEGESRSLLPLRRPRKIHNWSRVS